MFRELSPWQNFGFTKSKVMATGVQSLSGRNADGAMVDFVLALKVQQAPSS